VRREAANRVTIHCWYQRRCGALVSTLGRDLGARRAERTCSVCGCTTMGMQPCATASTVRGLHPAPRKLKQNTASHRSAWYVAVRPATSVKPGVAWNSFAARCRKPREYLRWYLFE
jgi:hypothetical protein